MNPNWSAVLWGVLYANAHGVQSKNILKTGLRKYAASGLLLERIHEFLSNKTKSESAQEKLFLSEAIERLMG